ncbi:hypothetical protein CLAIMM_07359 [Cladophialophora immunda]|nr:hypothetical protein CLAIMM_07359 [Cladophialophora immunda]
MGADEIDLKESAFNIEDTGVESINNSTGYALQPKDGPRVAPSGLERKLILKQDLLLLPLLALVYFVTYLDRNSFGNGRNLGLQKELNFSNQDYSNAAEFFFIGYTIFMFPGSIGLRFVSPNLLIGGAVVCFGSFLCGMSAAKSYGTVLAMRVLIGFGQALVQSSGVYSSLWYTRREIGFRSGIVFSFSTLSGAFSGLIAYALGKRLNKENSGRSPWQWLFLIEGVIAVFAGLLVIILLPRFPDRIKHSKKPRTWLFTEEEINLAVERSATLNKEGAKVDLWQIWACFKDPKSYGYAILNGTTGLCLSSVGVFLPTFIKDFGLSAVDSQLYSVIPYACAFVTLLVTCFLSDRINIKGPFIFCGFLVSAIGYIMLLTVKPTSVKILAACFITSGMYPSTVLMVAWLVINTGGFTKRASVWALAEVFSQCFSIMGANIYVNGPRYIKGHSVVLAFLVTAMATVVALSLTYRHLNKKRDRILEEYAQRGEIHPHMNKSLEELHDFHVNFRYTF